MGVDCKEGGICSQQLQEALQWARSASAIGLPVVIHIANGTYKLDSNAQDMMFNAETAASEVRLIGDGGAELFAEGTAPLLTVSTGAPPVVLSGLVIRSLIIVESGSAMIDRCRFEGSSAAASGLVVRDGSVRVQQSEFLGDVTQLEGGAISVSGGTLDMVDSTLTVVGGALNVCCSGHARVQQTVFVDNKATLGAISVSGGLLEIINSTLTRNVANDPDGGGALYASGGEVILKAKTLFLENKAAGVSQSVYVQNGSVVYTLPTPLGRWIPSFLTEPTTQLTLPQHGTADFPFACAIGIIGDSDKADSQSGPWCNGRCPAGYLCREATVKPEICPAGGYCGEGSPALSLCDDGTYGKSTGLVSQSNCTACPRGHSCRRGELKPLPCQPGYVAPDENTGACVACGKGTFQDAAGATVCKPCGPGVYCPAGSSAALACPAGSFSNASGMTTESECQSCPAGSASAAGATEPALCAPGSFAARTRMPACERCAAGSFQADEGEAACTVCPRAAWCAAGSSAPTPCAAGTIGSSVGLRKSTSCKACDAGVWCSTGVAFPCGPGTWSNVTRASNLGACQSCPEYSTTLRSASTELQNCLCDVGRYLQADAEGGGGACTLCPQPGSQCYTPGTTLASLTLAPGYWRSGNQSREPRLCPSYGGAAGEQRCIGGGGNTTCAGVLFGVYCANCPSSMYLDGSSGCTPCSGLTTGTASKIGVIAFVLTLLVFLRLCSTRLSRCAGCRTAITRLLARLSLLVAASGLPAKTKQLISFYQLATSVQSVFAVTFPQEVRSVLGVFSFLSLNVFELGLPTGCMGLGSFHQRLLFMLFLPIALLFGTLPTAWWHLRKAPATERGARALLLCALPIGLKVLFVFFPLVSALAVQAYDCETFDNGESWLRADYSLRCGSVSGDGQPMQWTPQYEAVRATAFVCVLFYALGVPLLFFGLLMSCRKQLSRVAPPTPRSASLSFLCSEYRKRWFYWEVVESVKKLFFVSLIRLAPLLHSAQGGMTQLLVAIMCSLTILVCQLSAAPYARPSDNLLSVLSNAAHCLLLLGALTLKLSSLTDALDEQLSAQLQGIFAVPAGPVLVVLLCSTLVSVIFSLAVSLILTLSLRLTPTLFVAQA